MAKQTVAGPYRVQPLDKGGYELMELVNDELVSLRPRKLYSTKQREAAYQQMVRMNRQWQHEQKEDALLVALCHELGETAPDEELIAGCRSNHHPDLIRDAANGDVAALVKLRQDFGLPIFV